MYNKGLEMNFVLTLLCVKNINSGVKNINSGVYVTEMKCGR